MPAPRLTPQSGRSTIARTVRHLLGGALLVLMGLAAIGALGRHLSAPESAMAQTPATTACTPEQVFARMNVAQRVGQLFMVGLISGASDEKAAETDRTITELHAGNVVLYGSTWNVGPVI